MSRPKHKVHFLPNHKQITTICRKYGLFDDEMIEEYKWTKQDQLDYGGTHDVKETTCEFCIKEILLDRYKRGLITL